MWEDVACCPRRVWAYTLHVVHDVFGPTHFEPKFRLVMGHRGHVDPFVSIVGQGFGYPSVQAGRNG
jgi:hypothetical protein